MLLDGIYVLGATHTIPLDDLERVEVIKGPQAAYFGRNTFGGAVNYITKNPSTEEWSGQVQASGATYEEYDVSASVQGPLMENKLGFRIGGRLYGRGNMWTASDGGGIGEQSTSTIYGTLYATPNENFDIKLRAFYARDDDGPPAGGFVGGQETDTCSGQTITEPDGSLGESHQLVLWIGAGTRHGQIQSGRFQYRRYGHRSKPGNRSNHWLPQHIDRPCGQRCLSRRGGRCA